MHEKDAFRSVFARLSRLLSENWRILLILTEEELMARKQAMQEFRNLKLKHQIVEIAPGDRFIRCDFLKCEFVGCGHAELIECHFVDCSPPRKPKLPLLECKGCTRNE